MVAKRFTEEVEVNLPGKTGHLRLHDCYSIYDMGHDMALLDDRDLTDRASGFPTDFGFRAEPGMAGDGRKENFHKVG